MQASTSSLGIAHQPLEGLRQQIAAIEATSEVTIDSTAFSARSSTSGSEKHNGKQFLSMSIAKNNGIPRNSL